MSKIKLGARPDHFKPLDVKFTMPDGSQGAIKATFKYRTRSEFGALLNQMFVEAGKEKPADGAQMDFQQLFTDTAKKNAEHLHASLHAWDVDSELTVDSLRQLADELPAAAAALMAAYSGACNEGRLGN